MAEQSPTLAYKHIREFLFLAWHKHRMAWLKLQKPKFGRGGKGVKVYKVAQNGKRTYKTVHYTLSKKRESTKSAVRRDFAKLDQAEIRADSMILKLLEEGGTTKPKSARYLTIPMRHRARNIEEFRTKYPKRAKTLVRKKRGSQVRIYEIKGKRKKKARIVFIQVPSVKNRKTLMFYKTWRRLKRERNRDWRNAATRMHEDLRMVLNGKSA